MDEASKTHIEFTIRSLVRAGRTEWVDLVDEVIPELLEGEGFDDDETLAWALSLADATWTGRVAEAATWQRPTGVDRLASTFAALNEKGFVCGGVEGSAYTQSDLLDDLVEKYHVAGGPASPVTGYLGCHMQDIERVIDEPGSLFLTHGRFERAAGNPAVETAEAAVIALRSAGFNIGWDGDPARRIEIREFVWRKDLPARR